MMLRVVAGEVSFVQLLLVVSLLLSFFLLVFVRFRFGLWTSISRSFFVTSFAFRGFPSFSWFLFLFLPLWFWLFPSLLLVALLPAFWSPHFGASFVQHVLTSLLVTVLFPFSRLCQLPFASRISLLAWKLTLFLFHRQRPDACRIIIRQISALSPPYSTMSP